VYLIQWLLDAARSSPAKPLKRIAHPSTRALEILPRQRRLSHDKRSIFPIHSSTLHHSDSFRLTLSAFDQEFYLHLRPNDNLVHPSARINYYSVGLDGRSILTHSEPLKRESVKAYWGEVIPAYASPLRMREDAAGVIPRPAGHPELGWARIMVHHQGDTAQGVAPVFEGAFSVNGVVHHVMTTDNYLRSKHTLDPEIHTLAGHDSPLVIWRDSDVMTDHEGVHSCSHDSLPYNTDPLRNPLLRAPPVSTWYDPLRLLADPFPKRDDISGVGMSTK
jgi:Reprolysin family propeptide